MNRTRILELLSQAAGEPHPDEDGLDEEHWIVLERFVGLVQQEPSQYPPPISKAAFDVQAERQRQIEAEGFSPDHDDAHRFGELAAAAGSYALWAAAQSDQSEYWKRQYMQAAQLCWPWDQEWWKPGRAEGEMRVPDPRKDLVRAGALIQAAIEREDRND